MKETKKDGTDGSVLLVGWVVVLGSFSLKEKDQTSGREGCDAQANQGIASGLG